MTFGKKLKHMLKEQKKTSVELAEYLSVTKGLVSHWCNDFRNPNPKQLQKIVEFLKIDASVLIGNNIRPVKSVPIIGTASCGACDINHLQDEGMQTYINADEWNKDLYSIIACGDSMFPHIKDGAELIIDPTIEPQHGDTVLYSLDDEYAVKILAINKEAHIMEFVPLNPNEHFKTRLTRLDDEDTLARLKIHLVKKILNPVEYNKSAILKMIGR